MAIQWTTALAVGVKDIDDQHAELIQRLDRVLFAVREVPGEVGGLLDYLGEYAVSHFTVEERLMEHYAYDPVAAASHREAHAAFVRAFARLRFDFDLSGITEGMRERIGVWMVGWLKEHILGLDRVLGQFISAKVAGVPRAGTWLVPRGEALAILAVTPWGSLAEAGLRPGDEIVEVAGWKVTELGTEKAIALLTHPADGEVAVKARPGGDPLRLSTHRVVRPSHAASAADPGQGPAVAPLQPLRAVTG